MIQIVVYKVRDKKLEIKEKINKKMTSLKIKITKKYKAQVTQTIKLKQFSYIRLVKNIFIYFKIIYLYIYLEFPFFYFKIKKLL